MTTRTRTFGSFFSLAFLALVLLGSPGCLTVSLAQAHKAVDRGPTRNHTQRRAGEELEQPTAAQSIARGVRSTITGGLDVLFVLGYFVTVPIDTATLPLQFVWFDRYYGI